MNVNLLIKENRELSEEKQRYKEMWFTANSSLAKYRDLEKQIGCPLEVVFKALTNGIYQEDGGRRKYPLIEYNSATKKFFFGFGTYCNVEDYKKAWWLKKDKSE